LLASQHSLLTTTADTSNHKGISRILGKLKQEQEEKTGMGICLICYNLLRVQLVGRKQEILIKTTNQPRSFTHKLPQDI